jgi:hypothetical protein
MSADLARGIDSQQPLQPSGTEWRGPTGRKPTAPPQPLSRSNAAPCAGFTTLRAPRARLKSQTLKLCGQPYGSEPPPHNAHAHADQSLPACRASGDPAGQRRTPALRSRAPNDAHAHAH